jgi:lipid-binding SYLF domain-containing protein
MRGAHRRSFLAALAALPLLALAPGAEAEDRNIINYKVAKALNQLRTQSAGMAELLDKAQGVLIMPDVTKASLVIGGAYGEGALRINGKTVDYYSISAASFGLQLGAQRTSQALLFMTNQALERFRRSDGWELGADAEVTVPDQGIQTGLTTTTAQQPVIAVTFGESGLMAGVSLAGAKYTKIKR